MTNESNGASPNSPMVGRRAIRMIAAAAIAGAVLITGTLSQGNAASIQDKGKSKHKGPKIVVNAHLKAMRANGVTLALVNQPPFSGLTPTGGATGAAPDVTVAVLKKLGVKKFNFVLGAYGDMIPGLLASRFDIVTAALSITPVRCQQVLFSNPLIVDSVSIASKKSGGPTYKNIKQIAADPSIKIGILTGSVYIAAAEAAGVSSSQFVQFTDVQSGITAVLDSRVQGMMGSTSGFHTSAVDTSQVKITGPVVGMPRNPSGAAFRVDDGAVRNDYNIELAAIQKSGQFDKILKKYGFNPKIARKASLAKACGH